MILITEIVLAAGQAPWWWGWTLLAVALFTAGWLTMGGRVGKRRHRRRREQQQAERAELVGLPITEYLALPRAERKQRIKAALGSSFSPTSASPSSQDRRTTRAYH